MKSLSLNAPGSVTVVEQDVDQSFSMMAVLRVISSGVCAADSYLWSGNHPWDITYPIVPGHEIFGEVIEGMDVIDKIAAVKTKPGDRPVENVKMTVKLVR